MELKPNIIKLDTCCEVNMESDQEYASQSSSFDEINEITEMVKREVRSLIVQRDLYWISDVPRIRTLTRFRLWIKDVFFGLNDDYFVCFDPYTCTNTSIQIYDGYDENSKLGLLNILDQLKNGGYPSVPTEKQFVQLRVFKKSSRMQTIFRSILKEIELTLKILEPNERSLDENFYIEETMKNDVPVVHEEEDVLAESPDAFDEELLAQHFHTIHPELSKRLILSIVQAVLKEMETLN